MVVAADAVPQVDVDLASVEVVSQSLQPHHVAGTVEMIENRKKAINEKNKENGENKDKGMNGKNGENGKNGKKLRGVRC
jgi:hypothetical protein